MSSHVQSWETKLSLCGGWGVVYYKTLLQVDDELRFCLSVVNVIFTLTYLVVFFISFFAFNQHLEQACQKFTFALAGGGGKFIHFWGNWENLLILTKKNLIGFFA